MKSMMKRSTFREIKQSKGRFFAIFAIIALGVGFFTGLGITKKAMLETGEQYLKQLNFYDYHLISTLGFTQENIDEFSKAEGIGVAEGAISIDFISKSSGGEESVLKAHSITDQVNQLNVVDGRLPEKANECVIDKQRFDIKIGDTIYLSDNNDEDTKGSFAYDAYTVVGTADSPLYLNFERGNTKLLNGKVSGFVYIPRDGFSVDYYTESYITLPNEYKIYSEHYNQFIEEKEAFVEELAETQADKRYEEIVSEARVKIDDAKAELLTKKADALVELNDAKQMIDDAKLDLSRGNREITKNETLLNDGVAQINQGIAQAQEAMYQLEAIGMTSSPDYATLLATQQQLQLQSAELQQNLRLLQGKRDELKEAQATLDEKEADYLKAKDEFDEEIADAEGKISDAEKELADIKEPEIFALTRDTNVGYVCFENDVDIVEGVAVVFPAFFLMVAALVCITTMNRMVEEQRTQIGVLKALGYSNSKIIGKYNFYAGSAAMLGAVFGYFVGAYIFPKTIWQAYGLMYGFREDVIFLLDMRLALISFVGALACSIGATYLSCYYELTSVPANLIRPKAPKNGKRIFLEKIGFLWNHLKFLHKVSIRNVLRYKKRFFMMILGISGCSALLVTGFGIKDSVSNLIPKQYGEIQTYDLMVSFDKEIDTEDLKEFQQVSSDIAIDNLMVMQESITIAKDGKQKSVTLVIPKESERLEGFTSLRTKEGSKIAFPKEGEIVLTHKIADRIKAKAGDTISIIDGNHRERKVTLSAVTENYVYHYGYMSAATYEKLFDKDVEYTSSFLHLKDENAFNEASARFGELSFVTQSSANQTFANRFDSMMVSLDYIVILVIACAAALAFIVLYNLTNINITERIREIATIKVLGFYPMETASYVFRENLILSVIGGLVGLLLGYFLHQFVMFKIDIEAIAFDVLIKPRSYLFSFALTFIFAMLVNLMMFKKLEKINMAESLKSIE